jgi:D-tyrosyl-tRNA(Tyr) deacylase
MRAAVQRVRRATVIVDGQTVAETGSGLLVYLGCATGDTEEDARYIAGKVAGLRVFTDEAGKLNRSVIDVGGDILLVSAFTLQADARKGRRPSFDPAAPPEQAEPLCNAVVAHLRAGGLRVETGRFRAHMLVDAVNDGPICILLDSTRLF